MSTTLSDYKKSTHRRYGSDELDVFEAARYFSDYNDKGSLMSGEEMMIKEGHFRQGRASLDMPSLKKHYNKHYCKNYIMPHQQQDQKQKQQQEMKEKKKYKQPSSPGGKLANFLSTLFNQATTTSSKKKNPKSTQSMKDEDESPSGRRKKSSSSVRHFRSTNNINNDVNDAKSFYSSSVSGFIRTPPPPYTINTSTTPTKTSQSLKKLSDYKEILTKLSKYKSHANAKGDKIRVTDQVVKKSVSKKFGEVVVVVDDNEDAESDASSDIFELQINDLKNGFSSTDELPVYETTHLDNIKRPLSAIYS